MITADRILEVQKLCSRPKGFWHIILSWLFYPFSLGRKRGGWDIGPAFRSRRRG